MKTPSRYNKICEKKHPETQAYRTRFEILVMFDCQKGGEIKMAKI